MPLRAPVGDQSPPLIGSSKKVIWRRAPMGLSTMWIWLVLPKRVLIAIRPSAVQPENRALRANW